MITLEVAIKNSSGVVRFDNGLYVPLSDLRDFELV